MNREMLLGVDGGRRGSEGVGKGSPPSLSSSPSSSLSSTGSGGDENEMTEELEETVIMELPMEPYLIHQFVKLYGNQPGADISSLRTREERTIPIPLDTAFGLFQALYSSVGGGGGGEELNKGRDYPPPFLRDEGGLNPLVWSTFDPEDVVNEDEELEDAIRAIQEMEDEKVAYLEQMKEYDELQKEKETVGLQHIMEEEKFITSIELCKFEKLMTTKWTMAQRVKCSQLRYQFPKLDEKIVRDIYLQNELKYDSSLHSLKEIYPNKFVDRSKSGNSQNCVVTTQKIPSSSGDCDWVYDPDDVAQLTIHERTEYLQQAAYWREECERLYKLYENARSDAIGQAVAPAASFKRQEASNYNGDAKKALELFWFFQLMGLNAANKNPNKIDLHGLSVVKAREVVQKYLQNRKVWANANLPQRSMLQVNIITGYGRHSKENVGRLYPAIKDFLGKNNYRFSDTGLGHFTVTIPNLRQNNPPSSSSKMKKHPGRVITSRNPQPRVK